MKILINFKHLPMVLCQLGKHLWMNEDSFNYNSEHIYKICITCGKEKTGYEKK